MINKKLCIIWPGRGFGEQLILARVTSILTDAGIDVIFKERYKVVGLVDCNKIQYVEDIKKYSDYVSHIWIYSIQDRTPIIVQYIKHFEEFFERKIEITRDHVPVIFNKMDVPTYDVILHTNTGSWSIYRFWPYFDELKSLLTKQGISWLDIADRKNGRIGGIRYLNYVNNAKLYVGLETGLSHYVSSIAKNKTLIIQGGFTEYNFWAYLYKFDHLEVEDVPCRPCYLNKIDIANGKGCPYNHRCMREISPQDVFNKIEKMLNEKIS